MTIERWRSMARPRALLHRRTKPSPLHRVVLIGITMSDIETRIQGVAMLTAVAFPVLGAAMAWSTITGRYKWINRVGYAAIGALAALLAVASVAFVVIVVALAVRMIVVGG